MSIVEIYPAQNGSAPLQRTATAPRDLASSIMLLLYCCLCVAAVCVALAAAIVAGAYYQRHRACLLSYMPNGQHLCYFTFVAAFLTLPLCAGILVTELLPGRLVSPGVRNLVPLALTVIGMALWGVEAAALHGRDTDRPYEGRWRASLQHLAWAAFSMFVVCCCAKLLSPALEPGIDAASICLGRTCPEGCMPACDACCCLDVRTAKVPREVLRHGRVELRFMTWNQELVSSSSVLPDGGLQLPRIAPAMAR